MWPRSIKVQLKAGRALVASRRRAGSFPRVSPAVALEWAKPARSPAPAQLHLSQLASLARWEHDQTELISQQQHPVALQACCLHGRLARTGAHGLRTCHVSTAIRGHRPQGASRALRRCALLEQAAAATREKANSFGEWVWRCAARFRKQNSL